MTNDYSGNLTEVEYNDLKIQLQSYLHESDITNNPVNLFSVDSPCFNMSSMPDNVLYSSKALHININSVPDKIETLKEFLSQFKDINI